MKKLHQNRVCSGARLLDSVQTLEKIHQEAARGIQNSAEESHWVISRKSVCAAGVVFSSELPHHTTSTTYRPGLLHWTDSALPSRSKQQQLPGCSPPALPVPATRLLFVPRDGGTDWAACTVGHCRNAEHSSPLYRLQTSLHHLLTLDTCRK